MGIRIDGNMLLPPNGGTVCVEPASSRRQRAAWVIWVYEDGSAVLYTEREEGGAVMGQPIRLPANIPRNGQDMPLAQRCKILAAEWRNPGLALDAEGRPFEGARIDAPGTPPTVAECASALERAVALEVQ